MTAVGYVDFGGVRYKLIDNGDSTVSLAVTDPVGWRIVRKTVTFTGAAGLGAVGTVTVFTTTGDVEVGMCLGKCTTDLTEGGATATVKLGTAADTSAFIDQANATAIDADEFWGVGGTPSRAINTVVNGVVAMGTGEAIAINQNVIITVGAQAVTGGVITFTCRWRPISVGATLVAA